MAYPNYMDVAIYPPPIQQVLRQRLFFFAEACPKNHRLTDTKLFPQHVGRYVEELVVTRGAIVRALRSVIAGFKHDIELDIAALANYDVRHQLRLAESVFHSWVLDWYDFLNLSVKDLQLDVNFYEVLSAMLRRDNLLVSPPPRQALYNIFDCGESSRFCSTLNGWYVLKLLDQGVGYVDDLVAHLVGLGHPKSVTLKTIQSLLEANIVKSREGLYLKEHAITQISCSWVATTLGHVYLELLPFQLRYLEAMSFLTPLDRSFATKLPIPDSSAGVPDFESYVCAAHVLFCQIRKDEERQRDYAKRHEVESVLEENGLLGLADRIAAQVRGTLHFLRGQGHFESTDWNHLLSLFAGSNGDD